MNQALILIDLQNDFMPGGSLAVPNGDQTIITANRLLSVFSFRIATLDYHPANHCSFASNHPGEKIGEKIQIGNTSQILWPDHCVQKTQGAELHSKLNQNLIDCKIHKGTQTDMDSYSGFFDNNGKSKTELDQVLKERHIQELFVLGLATDYCVKFTILDALSLKYRVNLVSDGCRAINADPKDEKSALEEMERRGMLLCDSKNILR